jgi:hypothetical protein
MRKESTVSILDVLEKEVKLNAFLSSDARSSLTDRNNTATCVSRARQSVRASGNVATDLSPAHSKASRKICTESSGSPDSTRSKRPDKMSLSCRLVLDKPHKVKSSDQSWVPTFDEVDFSKSPVKLDIKRTFDSTVYPKRRAKTPIRHRSSSSERTRNMDIQSPTKVLDQKGRSASSPRRRQYRSITKESHSHRTQNQHSPRTKSSEDDWVELIDLDLDLDTLCENRGLVQSKPQQGDFAESAKSPVQRSKEQRYRSTRQGDTESKISRVSHHSDTPKPKIKRRLTRKTLSDRDISSPTKQSSPIKSGRLGVAGQAIRRRNQTSVRTRTIQPMQ